MNHGTAMRTILLSAAILIASAAAAAEDYEAALMKLMSGRDSITAARQAQLGQQPVDSLAGPIAGVRFGDTMQQVIDVWGMPKAVWVQMEGHIQLSMFASTFLFINGRLSEIAIHSVDLPKLSMFGGRLRFDEPVPPLAELLPGATVTGEGGIQEAELPDGGLVRTQTLEGRLIAVTFRKP